MSNEKVYIIKKTTKKNDKKKPKNLKLMQEVKNQDENYKM